MTGHTLRALRRSVVSVILSGLLIAMASVAAWLGLEYVGVRLSLATVVALVTLSVVWIAASPRKQIETPPPPAPRPPLTRTEVEALLLLHREGKISVGQLNAALGDLIPPEPLLAPRDRGRDRR